MILIMMRGVPVMKALSAKKVTATSQLIREQVKKSNDRTNEVIRRTQSYLNDLKKQTPRV
ncbi:hypothetical protein ACE3NQ_15690 [Paenibacillus terreus]|uniref:Uncharacterized protein n=1 Tax=Paenibacillus terreus TaxID=1387834 RepID=A0ABV5BAK5_9BACL